MLIMAYVKYKMIYVNYKLELNQLPKRPIND